MSLGPGLLWQIRHDQSVEEVHELIVAPTTGNRTTSLRFTPAKPGHASVRPALANVAIRSTANAYPCTPHPAMTLSARCET